jgi:hypothetical protein
MSEPSGEADYLERQGVQESKGRVLTDLTPSGWLFGEYNSLVGSNSSGQEWSSGMGGDLSDISVTYFKAQCH